MSVFVKLKKSIKGHPIGQILRVPTDSNGIATDVFWRRRIDDSKTDKCLDVLRKAPKSGFLNA